MDMFFKCHSDLYGTSNSFNLTSYKYKHADAEKSEPNFISSNRMTSFMAFMLYKT